MTVQPASALSTLASRPMGHTHTGRCFDGDTRFLRGVVLPKNTPLQASTISRPCSCCMPRGSHGAPRVPFQEIMTAHKLDNSRLYRRASYRRPTRWHRVGVLQTCLCHRSWWRRLRPLDSLAPTSREVSLFPFTSMAQNHPRLVPASSDIYLGAFRCCSSPWYLKIWHTTVDRGGLPTPRFHLLLPLVLISVRRA